MESDRKEVEGRLFTAGSSHFVPAKLVPGPLTDGLSLSQEAGEEILNQRSLKLAPRIGTTARRVTLADGRVFETFDQDGLEALLRAARVERRGFALLAWLEVFRLRLIGVLAGLTLLAALFIAFVLPLIFDAAAYLVPYEVERELSAYTLKAFDATLFKPSKLSLEKQAEVEAVFHELLTGADIDPARYQLYLRDGGPVGANALALPGGRIVMTDQLIRLAKEEDAYAGVLAHEIGHVEAKHGTRLFLRSLGLSVILLLAVGDISGLMESAVLLPGFILQLSYTRDFEREADDYAVALMTKLGRDTAAMGELLRDIAKSCGEACEETSILSTHPGLRERLERFGTEGP